MSSEKEGAAPKNRLSCTQCFNAWFSCYSPFYQLQQYYRTGELENCAGKWSAFCDCLRLKTKGTSEVEKILEEREETRSHIWTFRTPQEGERFWKKHYRHLFDKP